MSDRILLQAILSLHKRLFPTQFDPMMVATHFLFLKQGFVIADELEEDNKVLPLNNRTNLNLKVDYRKDNVNIKAIYALNSKDYFLSFTINEKPYSRFFTLANYIRKDGTVFNDEDLIDHLNEFIKSSLNAFEKYSNGKDANIGKGGGRDDKGANTGKGGGRDGKGAIGGVLT